MKAVFFGLPDYYSRYIIRETLIRLFDTLLLLPRIVKSTGSNLINGALADKGGFEHQS